MTDRTPVLYPIIERPSPYERGTRYAHLYFVVRMREYDDRSGEYRYEEPSYWGDEKKWHQLRITSQISAGYDQPYAVYLEYRVGTVQAEGAEVMHKLLSAHKRKMTQYKEEWGEWTTYSEYVVRTMKAVGIKHVATIDDNGSLYLTNRPDWIKGWIDRTITDLRQAVQPSSHTVNEIPAQPATPAPEPSIPDRRPQPGPQDAVLGTGVTE